MGKENSRHRVKKQSKQQSDRIEYFIAYTLSSKYVDRISTFIDGLYRVYPESFRPSNAEMHITIKAPFEYSGSANTITSIITSLAEISPRTLRLGKPVSFGSRHIVLPAEFTPLQHTMMRGIPLYLKEHHSIALGKHEMNNTPHITIVRKIDSDFSHLFEACKEAPLPKRIELESLVLYKRVAGGPWEGVYRQDINS